MARIDGKFIKGTAGPTVYKKYRNMQIVQSRPRFTAGSQTEGTKKAASGFGQASKLAVNMRDNLNTIITDFYDGTMVNRMNSDAILILAQSLNADTGKYEFNPDSFNRLNGFEFNSKSLVRDMLFTQPEVEVTGNTLKVSLPELHLPKELKFPSSGLTCVMGLATGIFDLANGRMILRPIQSMEIIYSFNPVIVPAQQFDFEIEPGCLCITVLSLQFIRKTFAGNMVVNSKDFNPVAILRASAVEGTANKEVTKTWKAMTFKTG